MATINPAPPDDDLDACPSFRYPKLEEQHLHTRCRWVKHSSRTVNGQIELHFHRECHCQRFSDRSAFSTVPTESAPSQAVLRADPQYGYDIHFSPMCRYERFPLEKGTIILWIRRCVCTTPKNWSGQSTQQRTNTVRPHAGYGG